VKFAPVFDKFRVPEVSNIVNLYNFSQNTIHYIFIKLVDFQSARRPGVPHVSSATPQWRLKPSSAQEIRVKRLCWYRRHEVHFFFFLFIYLFCLALT